MKNILILLSIIALVSCQKIDNSRCGLSGKYLVLEKWEDGVKVDSSTINRQLVTYFYSNPLAQTTIYQNGDIVSGYNILVSCEEIYDTTDSTFKMGNTQSYMYFKKF